MIDLHVHSTISDGTFSPTGLAEHARELGLEAFALTDHDSVEGNAEAAAAAARLHMDFINGMEMSVAYKNRRLHIVCLGFDQGHPEFIKLYDEICQQKYGCMDEVVELIRKNGVDITMDEVRTYASGPISSYTIVKCLANKNICHKAQLLWDNYLNPAMKELGVGVDIPVGRGLSAIRAAGGVTILAHFHKRIGLKGMNRFQQEMAIEELKAYGLNGIEIYYPNFMLEDSGFAASMVSKYHLLASGGSDFHGANRPEIEMGRGYKNNLQVPYKILQEIKQFMQNK